jgi:hypothetical protein
MMQLIPIGILAFLLLRDRTPKEDEEEQEEETTPTPRPDPSETKWTETASWSGEYAKEGYDGTERVVWVMQTGIRYQDGSTEMDDTEYILIGNKSHTAFRSANSDRGTIDIKKEYTGGTSDVKNAIVYPDLDSAIAKVDELSEPPSNDDPTSPQPQPQPDPDEDQGGNDDGFGGLPSQGGLSLGQGYGSFSM